MFIARIDGSITSTVKHKSLNGVSLLIGQRLDTDGSPVGEPQVIIDTMRAAWGSKVLVSTDGDLARHLLRDNTTPTRLVVVGLLD
ncbi:MAG TPA: EutN/CcmL family microcompartment protein [Acidobacteriota bacterium]|nr:EutN/CcmL family microcompartment protein [Acidobacteriota bacterium]